MPTFELVQIPKILLLHPCSYMEKDGQYDLLGCLLLARGISIPEKTKFPSQLKRHVPPFTVQLRRSILDSPLTQSILKLDVYPQKELLTPLNNLLAPHNIQVTFV